MQNISYRQGDLLIVKIDILPQDMEVDKDGVILRGEKSGHAHRVEGRALVLKRGGNIFLKVDGKATLVHDEHMPIKLEKGNYAVIRQREYVSAEEEQYVQD